MDLDKSLHVSEPVLSSCKTEIIILTFFIKCLANSRQQLSTIIIIVQNNPLWPLDAGEEMNDGWSPHKHCVRSMQALLQCWSGLLVCVPTNPHGDKNSKHISWLTTDWSYVTGRKKISNPIALPKLHSFCFDHRRKKVILAKFSAYEESCFQFVLGITFADEPSELDMKKTHLHV